MDSAFGRSIVEVMSKTIKERGGEIAGTIWHPLENVDFSSFILQAQASGADVLVFANSGTDFVRAVKQAREFGLTGKSPRIVGPAITAVDIGALGPQDAQGLQYIDAFYWNLNDGTRQLASDFRARRNVNPGQAQAGVYSAVRSYLKAIETTGSDEAAKVLKAMRETTIADNFTPSGRIRADGRMVHEMYLMRAMGPGEKAEAPWDFVRLVRRVPGDDAFRPLAESQCPLVRQGPGTKG